MLLLALLISAPAIVPLPTAARSRPPAPSLQEGQDRKAEYEKKRAEADGDAAKLWKLYDWCEAYGMDREGRSVLRAILKINDNDRKAHELLGELEYDGKWFPNERKLEEYKAKKLAEDAKKQGKVVYKGEIVDPADVEKLERGMRKLDNGRWVDAEEYQHITEGWVRQDLEWIPPAEAGNIEKGLWKCGDKWLTEPEADAYHAEIGKWWRIPSDHFVLYSTNPRALTLTIRDECENAVRAFNRVLGKIPGEPTPILALNSQAQYNQVFSEGIGGAPTELRGFSSLRGATIAEVWQEPLRAGMTSAGVFFWDKDFGFFYARHAAAQSMMEALDPSPKALASASGSLGGRGANDVAAAWWKEKRLPEWFRYGACTYVERYLPMPNPPAGQGPEYWRNWSIGNILSKGGLDPVDKILEFGLTLDSIDASQKLLNEAGLLVSFILDGQCAPVIKEHQALKDAFKNGKDMKGPIKALESALEKNEAELRKYAGA